jgi:hypothetical protein
MSPVDGNAMTAPARPDRKEADEGKVSEATIVSYPHFDAQPHQTPSSRRFSAFKAIAGGSLLASVEAFA